MDKETKEKWLKALRSGEYRQGMAALRTRDGNMFCCLGVLCDLYLKEVEGADWEIRNDRFFCLDNAYILPNDIQDWAELNSENVWIGSLGKSLADLNDIGMTFEEIAEVIEREL